MGHCREGRRIVRQGGEGRRIVRHGGEGRRVLRQGHEPRSDARARNDGFLIISSKASVCISIGTLLSPSATSEFWIWLER